MKLLTIDDVCTHFKCSRSKFYQLLHSNLIPKPVSKLPGGKCQWNVDDPEMIIKMHALCKNCHRRKPYRQ